MNKVYLISEAYLKANTLIDDNVDNHILIPAVEFSQDIRLVELIGQSNVNELKDYVVQINEGGLIDEFLNEALNYYVIPFLAAQVVAEVQIPLQYKIKNAGVITNQGDRIQTTTSKDIQYLTKHYENIANSYAEKVVTFYEINNKTVEENNIYPCDIYTSSICVDNNVTTDSPKSFESRMKELIADHNYEPESHPFILEEIKKISEKTGVEEAPIDGKLYGRENQGWREILIEGVTEEELNSAISEFNVDVVQPISEKATLNTENIKTANANINSLDAKIINAEGDIVLIDDRLTLLTSEVNNKLSKDVADSLYVSKVNYIPFLEEDKLKLDSLYTTDEVDDKILSAKNSAITESKSYTDTKIGDIDTVLDYIINQQNTI